MVYLSQQQMINLHSCKAGILLNLAKVAYGGLMAAKLSKFKMIIWKNCLSCKSSASHDYPVMLFRICCKSPISKIVAFAMLQNKLCQYGRTDT